MANYITLLEPALQEIVKLTMCENQEFCQMEQNNQRSTGLYETLTVQISGGQKDAAWYGSKGCKTSLPGLSAVVCSLNIGNVSKTGKVGRCVVECDPRF